MTTISSADREQQRFEHLVLGRARQKVEVSTSASRKKRSRRVAVRAAEPPKTATLAPGIEERVAMRERWSHKNGTAETHEHVYQARLRPGSIARLYESGALDEDQLAAAEQIAEAYRSITAAVAVRTASLEARIDGSAHGRAEEEQLGRVTSEHVYREWRASIGRCAQALLPVTALTLACDGVEIADGGFYMIHQAWTFAMGNADDMEATAKLLAKVDDVLVEGYAKKTGKKSDEVLALMRAETWFTAQEAVDGGFADKITEVGTKNARAFNLAAYANAPKALTEQQPDPEATRKRMLARAGLYERTAA